jgi:hypothetical protein
MSKIRYLNVNGLLNARLIGLVIPLFLSVGLLVGSQLWGSSPASLNLDDLPVFGWQVCEDMGMGDVPGVPEQVQRFRLCNHPGWELLAYCLEPEEPPPPVETICERIDDNTYWCGDEYQQLRHFQILQTPTPAPPATATPTDTSTPTPTVTPTSTSTVTLTTTPSPTATPTFTDTPTTTTEATATVTPRPPMGGRGNAEPGDLIRWATGSFFIGLGLTLAWVELLKRVGISGK